MRNPNCTLCPLHETAKTVCVWGSGPAHPTGMIVGMNPGAHEDETGLPFVGPSGKKLNELLKQVGLDRKQLYVTNAVKCRTPGNMEPSHESLTACRPYLEEETREAKPLAILALGNTALRTLTGKSGINSYRHMEIPLRPSFSLSIPVFVTYHPSYLLKGNDAYLPDVLTDLRRFKSYLDGVSAGEEGAPPIQSVYPGEEITINDVSMISYDVETDVVESMHTLTSKNLQMIQIYDGRKVYIFEGLAIPEGIRVLRNAAQRGVQIVSFNGAKFDDEIINSAL